MEFLKSASKEARTKATKEHFGYFLTYYFPHYVMSKFATFHYDMMGDIHDLIDLRIRELAWFMFGESAKTSFAKAFIIYMIVYDIDPYINADAFDSTNSERVLFDIIHELQLNRRLREDFGELYNVSRTQTEATQKRIKDFITNPKRDDTGNIIKEGVRCEAHTTQESVRGRTHGPMRPGFVLMDDFETKMTLRSEVATTQIKTHIQEFKRGLDSSRHRVLYLGNMLSEFGNVQSIVDRVPQDSNLRVRVIPVCLGTLANMHSPTWPERWVLTDEEGKQTGKPSIESKKRDMWTSENGDGDFQAEMLCQPINPEGQDFSKKWFKYKTRKEVDDMITRKFATIDSALSKKTSGNKDPDFTGVTKNYIAENNDWHFSARRYAINSKGLIDLIFRLDDEGFEKIGLEETAFTQAIEPFFIEECEKRNKYPYVIPLKHGGIMKETRIRGLIPRYETGKIYHIEGECHDLEEEALRFPNGAHDDVLDSAQYQNKISEAPYAQRNEQEQEEEAPLYEDIGI